MTSPTPVFVQPRKRAELRQITRLTDRSTFLGRYDSCARYLLGDVLATAVLTCGSRGFFVLDDRKMHDESFGAIVTMIFVSRHD